MSAITFLKEGGVTDEDERMQKKKKTSQWLSITTTGVEVALLLKPAPMRLGSSGNSPSWIASAEEPTRGFFSVFSIQKDVTVPGLWNQLLQRSVPLSSALCRTALPKPNDSGGIWRQSYIMVFVNSASICFNLFGIKWIASSFNYCKSNILCSAWELFPSLVWCNKPKENENKC